jgi:hypothetical protein
LEYSPPIASSLCSFSKREAPWRSRYNSLQCKEEVNDDGHTMNTASKFFRTHQRSLSLLGALIVFTTFIVKDAIRDHAKDLVDSIDSAESAYRSGIDLTLVSKEIIDTELRIDHLSEGQSAVPSFQKEHVQVATDILTNTSLYLDKLEALNRLLPENQQDQTSIESAEQTLKEDQAQINDLFDKARQPSVLKSDTADDERSLSQIESRLWFQYWQARPLGDKLARKAEATKNDREARYRSITIASYGLYTLGWGLALFARILGGDDPISEDD